MNLNLGIEPRDEYLSFELAKGARKLLEGQMLVKPGETVLITGDTSSDKRVMDAIAQAAYAMDAVPVVLYYHTMPNACTEPPAPVSAAAQASDVWVELSYAYVMHSPGYQKALANGVRYTCLTGMDVEMMVKCVSRVDFDALMELGNHLKSCIAAADEVIIQCANGTNLKAYNRGRRVRQSGSRAEKKGESVMMGGQISWCPVEETINGTIVFDGAVYPPSDICALNGQIKLEFKEGRLVSIEGGREAKIYEDWFASFNDPDMYRLAHYSLGFNPGVTKITGRIVEDERVFGCIEFGIGSQGRVIGGAFWSAASHTDGTVLKPTIILDGKVFEENGVYKESRTRELCRKLGVTGY